jgi:hypothetical protein
MRIVSLPPSATEMISALGLEDPLVGVAHECDFPALVRGLPKVTGTLIPAEAPSAEIDRLVRQRLRTSYTTSNGVTATATSPTTSTCGSPAAIWCPSA